ncbi:MAG: diacylglycerol kinase family protein [Chitinophagales bacterium]|nr:diacylglycerol kinase family protein [Chitinophagaceae bacterium]MBP9884394.1 diacylglycerol kinase family protein [Chitinophagales bacterium]
MKRRTFLNSLLASFSGLKSAVRSEINLKFHLIAAGLVVIAGMYFNIQRSDWLWLIVAISVVLIAEYLNTAIERLTDLVSPKFDPKAGDVKDIAAGAVLLASFAAIVIGVIIFLPHFFPGS